MYPEPEHTLSYDTPDKAFFFSHGYDPLNIWSPHQIKIWGKKFATVGHAYEYKKMDLMSQEIADEVYKAPSPWAAYQIAEEHKGYRRDDWDRVKVTVMLELIRAKYQQHEDVRQQLAKTGKKVIIENSPWDTFWGGGKDGTGRNALGKIWMFIRDNPENGHVDSEELLSEFDI